MIVSTCKVKGCQQAAVTKCHCQFFELCNFHIEEEELRVDNRGKLRDIQNMQSALNSLKRAMDDIANLIVSKQILIEDLNTQLKTRGLSLQERLSEIDIQIEKCERDSSKFLKKAERPGQPYARHSKSLCINERGEIIRNEPIGIPEQVRFSRVEINLFPSLKINTHLNREFDIHASFNKIARESRKILGSNLENAIIKSLCTFFLNLEKNNLKLKTDLTPATASSIQEENHDFVSDSAATFKVIDSNSVVRGDGEFSPLPKTACACVFCSGLIGCGVKRYPCGCVTCNRCVLSQYAANS